MFVQGMVVSDVRRCSMYSVSLYYVKITEITL